MTGFEWFLFCVAVAALFMAHLNGREWKKTIDSWGESNRQWNEANEGWRRTIDMVRAWRTTSASFHRRAQRAESDCCRLRRDLINATARAEWWRSEAKRLGWKPEQDGAS